MFEDLQGKRVLITGASGGIGAGIARCFAGYGARIMVHYRSREAGARQTVAAVQDAGAEAHMVHADLRSEQALERLVQTTQETLGGIDVLINNAGVVLKASILDADARYWDDTMNINVRAPYLLSRAVAQGMIDTGTGGVILHNGSIHGSNSVENFSAYAVSKASLEALTRVQALEWAEHGIRVNTFAPGVVPVERTAEMLEASKEIWLPAIPLGRYGQPEDIGKLCVFLASEASGWVTGQTYVCDGGALARMNLPKRAKPPLPPPPSPIENDG